MIVDAAWYLKGVRQSSDEPISQLLKSAKRRGGFVWVGLAEPSPEEFSSIVGDFSFHPLAVEDAIHAKQRPKLEEYEGLTFLVARTTFFDTTTNQISTGELLFFIGKNFIVIVRHGEGTPLRSVRQELEARPEFLQQGPEAVLHSVLDRVIDEYSIIAAELENSVIDIETKVFSGTRQTQSQGIYLLKREVIEFRHSIEPLIGPLQELIDDEPTILSKEIKPFFRDLSDHLNRACDQAIGLDALLTDVLHVDLAHLQVQQNEDVRKISSWVALASVPTMVAGIYGMNFHHMPELSWKYGYPIVLGTLLLITGFLARKFKKAKWL